MFGYVRVNKMDLTYREFETYKAYYCGLCKYLKRNHTEISRLSINYDITFLIVLLTSVYEPHCDIFDEKCIVNPIKEKKHIVSEITEYAASMNILLTYGKLEDDVMDDGNLKSRMARGLYKKSFESAIEKYPEKYEFISSKLKELHQLEEDKIYNIDLVSNIFGEIMSEVAVYKDDEYASKLSKIGFNIGKYIYILDAYEDLDEDVKKNRYNPFYEYKDDRKALTEKVDRIISMTLSMLEKTILELDLKLNRTIIENIVYSGIYLRYKGILYNEK